MIGLMVVHGAAAGNFSPLNVLGAMVHQAVHQLRPLDVLHDALRGEPVVQRRAGRRDREALFRGRIPVPGEPVLSERSEAKGPAAAQVFTLLALLAVAVVSLGFGLSIGFVAFAAAVLHPTFLLSSSGAESTSRGRRAPRVRRGHARCACSGTGP